MTELFRFGVEDTFDSTDGAIEVIVVMSDVSKVGCGVSVVVAGCCVVVCCCVLGYVTTEAAVLVFV